jgi:hypothetical protein
MPKKFPLFFHPQTDGEADFEIRMDKGNKSALRRLKWSKADLLMNTCPVCPTQIKCVDPDKWGGFSRVNGLQQ